MYAPCVAEVQAEAGRHVAVVMECGTAGGPGELYRDSVYPNGCFGSLGLALDAGITLVNLTESQFGIGTRLPSERELTGALDVSRTTVTRAYEVLRESGYAEARCTRRTRRTRRT